MLQQLLTEQRNATTGHIDQASTMELLRIINDEDAKVAGAVQKELGNIAAAVDGIYERMKQGGRLIYVGCGTSGRLGVVDASEIPPTYSANGVVEGWMAGGDAAIRRAAEGAEDSYPHGYQDMDQFNVTQFDSMVGIAASGRTPYVLGALQHAKDKGAFTIGLTFNANTLLASAVDVNIAPLCGPEVVTGSTRMKAGTATKLVLNMLSTAAMVKMGKTLGNLMVDVKASNEKLRVRSVRIISLALTEHGQGRFYLPGSTTEHSLDDQLALQQLMEACHGLVKLSILVGLTGLHVAEAEALLEAKDGVLRRALDACNHQANFAQATVVPAKALGQKWAVAVDCGGTKMEATVVDQLTKQVVGTARVVSTNLATTPLLVFTSQIKKVIQLALDAADAPLPDFEAVWIGSAGCGNDALRNALHDKIADVFASTPRDKIKVTSDGELLAAHLLNTGKEQGVIVIAGTGSIALRCNAKGDQLTRAGGLGYLMGDEGSGWALGVQAIKHTGKVLDGRASASAVSQLVVQHLGCAATRQALQGAIYQAADSDMDRKTRICGLARVVIAAAMDHACPVAHDILVSEASELAATAATIIKDGDVVILGGGLLSVPAYSDILVQQLANMGKTNLQCVKIDNVSTEAALALN
ncbi:hypothetical protein BC940DRAFT_232012 [Gongronella butleri]|nr:hypothetical protein BC940DRAFT_232012 [Gongronella butleri]